MLKILHQNCTFVIKLHNSIEAYVHIHKNCL